MSTNFNTYSRYYDLLYRDKNYEEESKYVTNLIRKFKPDASSILEMGAGSGSHAYFLAKNGFKITGIERSSEMVRVAKSKEITGFEPLEGDITDFNLFRKYDVVISLFHVISYLTDNESLIKCFNLANEHLVEGGLFGFDVWYSPAVYSQRAEVRIKRMEDDHISVTRIAEPEIDSTNSVINVKFEVNVLHKRNKTLEVITEKHPMRHFSLPEVDLLARLTGFKIMVSEEFITANSPSENTWGVCFLLKKVSK